MSGWRSFLARVKSPGTAAAGHRGLARRVVWLLGLGIAAAVRGADPAEVQQDLIEGDYAAVIREAGRALKAAPHEAEWVSLLARAQVAIGRHNEADALVREALEHDTQSIRLRWLAREVALVTGKTDDARRRVDEIRRLVGARSWNYRSAPDLVVFGRAALELGADPKDVLEKVYAIAQRSDPKLRDVYLARGELALSKHDFALAARAFEEGLKVLPDDPDLLSGRALAYADGEREVALESLRAALEINSRHVPSLLQMAEHHIDAEAYDEAEKTLQKVVAVNPTQPDAWAYRAVIAHLRNDAGGEQAARARALSTWQRNPRVDYLIGKKLSQKYRFAEGAAYQRRAREYDPSFMPAAAQLATDLLRLGDDEGWSLAQAVHERDGYDVQAFNLVTLQDTMKNYAALTNEDFVVRMSGPEVAVYGPRVMALLRRAKEMLVTKYGAQLAAPTFVEIFADQKDFAVRTFGLPDVPGFLGVCFGRVVTANSPATSSSPTNWESVLWHEFCHVVTLQMTRNKMPRWLSEGISVHEERLANPAWGMRLNPRYRQMILDGEMAPVGRLSGAFLAPKSSEHLQFAYLQSSLVVDYIVERFGQAALRGILHDLRTGAEINVALANHTVALPELEKGFEAYAKEKAGQLAPGLDWEKPELELLLPGGGGTALAAWEQKNPDNYWALRSRAQRHAEEKNWPEARRALERLIELYPNQKGSDTPYRPLVAALKALGDRPAELAALKRWVEVDDEAPDAYLRLMELAAADQDWPTVARNADRYLAVNPLVAPPYRYQATAFAETGDVSGAIVAWRTLLQLNVPDITEAHFNLARLLHGRGEQADARRHVLFALEETPRYREALRLLRDIDRAQWEAQAGGPVRLPEPALTLPTLAPRTE